MRFNNIPDLGNLWLLPTDMVKLILMFLGCFGSIALTIFILRWLKLRIPSSQELKFFEYVTKSQDLTLEGKIMSSVKDQRKERMRETQRRQKEIEYKRYRIKQTPTQVGNMAVSGWGIIMMIIAAAVFLVRTILTMKIGWAFILPVVVGAGIAAKHTFTGIINLEKERKIALQQDLDRDIYNFLLEYKYSDPSVGIFNYIKSAIPTSNSLMVDLTMLITDMNTFTAPTALDNFAKRAKNPIIDRFVSILKLNLQGGISDEQFKISIDSLANDTKIELSKKEQKRLKKKATFAFVMAFLGLSAAGILVIVNPLMTTMIEVRGVN